MVSGRDRRPRPGVPRLQAIRVGVGWEHVAASPAACRHYLAAAAVADVTRLGPKRVAVLAVSLVEAEDIVDRMRGQLRRSGHIDGPELAGPAWGPGERRYAAGDRVILHANTLVDGVRIHNGSTGTVLRATSDSLTVALDTGTSTELPAEFVTGSRPDGTPNLSHGWARTIDGAQGCTWDQVHLLAGPSIDRDTIYVGQSRGRLPTHTWNSPANIDTETHGNVVRDKRTPDEIVLAAASRIPRTASPQQTTPTSSTGSFPPSEPNTRRPSPADRRTSGSTPLGSATEGGFAPIDSTLRSDGAGFVSGANTWSVRFDPFGAGGVSVVGETGDTMSFEPVEGTPAVPELQEDGTSVLYRDVWPGVDVRYSVNSVGVKEEIVVREASDRSRFGFTVTGPGAASLMQPLRETDAPEEPPTDAPQGVDALGSDVLVSDGGLAIGPVEVFDADGRPATAESSSDRAVETVAKDSVVVWASVDAAWLDNEAAEGAMPVVVDPSIIGRFSDGYAAIRSDGYWCTTPVCGARIGNSRDGGDTFWRTPMNFTYEDLFGQGFYVTSSTLNLTRTAGTTSSTRAGLYEASSWSYGGIGMMSDLQWGTTSYSLNATPLVQSWVQNELAEGDFMLLSDEPPGVYNYKEFSAQLDIVYWAPPTQATPVAPADGAVVNALQPTLQVNTATDPDGSTVSYWYALSTSPGSGQLLATGWLSATTSYQVPAGVLEDGRTYYWKVYTRDGQGQQTNPNWVRSFRVNRRLGADPTQPMDSFGPVSVNLANGNLVTGISSSALAAVGGGISVGLTYNSQAAPSMGLQGAYFADTDQNGLFDDGGSILTRVDTQVAFNWGAGSPAPSMLDEHFLGRWSGQLTVGSSGSYIFGASADDGLRIWVNGTQVVNRWSSASGVTWGSSISLTGGTSVPVVIEYRHATGLADIEFRVKGAVSEQPVPTAWLVPQVAVVPNGWSLSATGGLAVRAARVADASVVLTDDTGMTSEYRWNGTAYLPPAGENGSLVRNSDGTLTFDDSGYLVRFRADGSVLEARSTVDDTSPAATSYTWDSNGRLTTMTDPVSSRSVTLRYGGDGVCPSSPPSGLSVAPSGMLCVVELWDSTSMVLWYTSGGELSRVVNPGSAVTDFAYSSGRLSAVRDALAADAVAAAVRTDDATVRTAIAYDGSGRVSSVTLPAAASGATRAVHNYGYSAGSSTVSSPDYPTGPLLTFAFDATGRITSSTDAVGKVMTQTWDGPDRVLSSTDPAGLVTQQHYDAAGRPTVTYGPAPSSCFNGSRVPDGTCTNPVVPSSSTAYDEAIAGLAGTFWSNATMAGTPVSHGTGAGNPDGSINNSAPIPIGSAPRSARWTGEIVLPATGTYKFSTKSQGGVRVWIDDVLVVNDWTDKTAWTWSDGGAWSPVTVTSSSAGSVHRITVEHFDANSSQGFELWWLTPAAVSQVVPGASLRPRYGLATTTTDADGLITVTGYATPHLRLATTSRVDPSGLNLTNTTTFEVPGSGAFARRLSRTLPAGNQTTYTYHGLGANPASVDDPCTAGTQSIHQGGALRTATGPDPTGADVALVEEAVYDLAGRTIASRIGSDPWTCTSYDSRGRVASVAYPAFGGEPARTVTSNYAVGGNPLVSSVTDAAGTISTTVDLLGRITSYTEVSGGTTTYVYDALGRRSSSTGPAGTVAWTYDAAGKVETMSLDGLLVADPAYDSAGRLSTVAYPTGTGNGGNGTALDPIGFDTYGRINNVHWKAPGGGTITRDQVTRSSAGTIVDQSVDGTDPYGAGSNYVYDAAGRLTTAYVPGRTVTYGFAPTGGCGALATAGANTSRTSQVISGVTTTYCYDQADRLTSTTATGVGTIAYDGHGNTTSISSETHKYDAADRHVETTAGATTVRYVRDALNRIVSRSVNGTVVARYGHSLGGDSPSYTMNAAGTVIERTVALPGGVLLTKRSGGDVWSYPNIHGDVAAVANSSGVKQGATIVYDPFGNPVTGALPDNSADDLDYGWLGQHQRPLEHDPTLHQVIEMGARQYSPLLGRFLQTDPIEGGNANDYTYPADPVNMFDLDGRISCNSLQKKCQVRVGSRSSWYDVGSTGALFAAPGARRTSYCYTPASGGRRCRTQVLVVVPNYIWVPNQAYRSSVDMARRPSGGGFSPLRALHTVSTAARWVSTAGACVAGASGGALYGSFVFFSWPVGGPVTGAALGCAAGAAASEWATMPPP